MKEIRLKRLTLKDFQGGSFVLDVNGSDTYIYGENGSGKTRLVSGFTWLLFGKDALGRSDFQIKNLDAKGEAEHDLQHSVEAVLQNDGETIILKKTFSEVWQKKRGSTKATVTGHTNEFYIDGVPTAKKLFDEKVTEIAGSEETFRLLTSPIVFPNLPWQKARSILLEVCGDISTEDVIASDEKLGPLPKILGKKTIDDLRKIITVRRTEINKELSMVPIRIDEQHRSLPDITRIDRAEVEKEAQRLEIAVNDAKLRLQGVDTGGALASLTKKLSGLNADLRKMEEGHRAESLATINRLNQEISEVGVKVGADRRRVQAIEEELRTKRLLLQNTEATVAKLRDSWIAVDAEQFKGSVSDVCPSCGQALPVERVQEAKDKALAAFNSDKADRLKNIHDHGINQRANCDRLIGEMKPLDGEREGLIRADLPSEESKLKALTDERDALKESSEDFSSLPHWSETFGEIEAYEQEIKAEREGKAEEATEIREKIDELQKALFHAKSKVDLFRQREQGEKRIEELKAEEKKLSAEFEKLEGELYLIEAFIRAKVSMLTTRINEKFETVRFKLFDLQVNGALAECCQITVNGVPFDGGLNNGARINAGLEIVKVLQQHYQLKAPVFADNAEAVNNLVDVGCQMIKLFVSDDKNLRVEFGEAAKAGNTEVRSRSSARRLTLS